MDSSTSNSDGNSSHVRTSEPDDSLRIRKNLMLKLGVHAELSKIETQRAPSRGSLLGKVRLSTEPLKGNEEEPERVNILTNLVSFFTRPKTPSTQDDSEGSLDLSSSLSEEESSTSLDGEQATRRLTFNEEVSVCPIPKRQEYSKRIREHLWNSPAELMLNCERNSIEFAAEGWDWRNSLEDEYMYRCVATNELIHPVHVEGHPV
jgi:hypothetical protein